MKIFFIVNPVAGKHRNPYRLVKRIRKVCRELKADYAVRLWEYPEQIGELVDHAIRENFGIIVAAGGDGTVHAIGKRLIGKEVALGIIPVGSGNGFARHLGYSRNAETAIRQVIQGRIIKADTGIFGGIPFLNSAGIGMDAEVAEQFSHSSKRGLQSYVQLGTKTFLKFRSFPVTLEVDGNELHWDKIFFLDITNGTEWGNGAKISPQSKITDGSFTTVVVPRTAILKVPKMINQLFRGKLDKNKNVKMIPGKNFRITRPAPGVAHVDGDPVFLGENIECKVLPASLHVVTPPGKVAV